MKGGQSEWRTFTSNEVRHIERTDWTHAGQHTMELNTEICGVFGTMNS